MIAMMPIPQVLPNQEHALRHHDRHSSCKYANRVKTNAETVMKRLQHSAMRRSVRKFIAAVLTSAVVLGSALLGAVLGAIGGAVFGTIHGALLAVLKWRWELLAQVIPAFAFAGAIAGAITCGFARIVGGTDTEDATTDAETIADKSGGQVSKFHRRVAVVPDALLRRSRWQHFPDAPYPRNPPRTSNN